MKMAISAHPLETACLGIGKDFGAKRLFLHNPSNGLISLSLASGLVDDATRGII